jgi:hypothetical protein
MMTAECFIYNTKPPTHCIVCAEKTFIYKAGRLTWCYCAGCKLFFTPCTRNEIRTFLVDVRAALNGT